MRLNSSSIELTLDGGAEDDVLIGGGGDDTLFGRDGDDELYGGGTTGDPVQSAATARTTASTSAGELTIPGPSRT